MTGDIVRDQRFLTRRLFRLGLALLGVLFLLALLLTARAAAQPPSRNSINGLAVQPDGKIVAVGLANGESGTRYEFGIARYNADGTLDASFSGDGKVTEAFGAEAEATAVALQSDGKIVVVGSYFGPTPESEGFAVARFNSDGSLDTSFSGDGLVTVPLGENSRASSVALQNNGDIVIAGDRHDYADGIVVRLLGNGELDTSFSGDGVEILGAPWGYEGIRGIAIQSDGKIVAVGEDQDSEQFLVERLESNGGVDESFGVGGETSAGPPRFSNAEAVAIQSDGKIVVTGTSGNAYTNDYTVVRYESDGSLDTSFSGDGIATADLGGFDVADSVAIQPDGAILAGGEHVGVFGIARFLPDGANDPSFGNAGVMMDHPETSANAMALQSDGAILLGGSTSCCEETSAWLLSRYTNSGVRDTTFGTNGNAAASFGTPEAEPEPEPEPSNTGSESSTPSTDAGSTSSSRGSGPAATAPISTAHHSSTKKGGHKPLKCRRGFKKGKVHGKAKCVKAKKRHVVGNK